MALVALAQAVATAEFGPRRPYWIETWPLAALTISLGMVKAETLSGPCADSRAMLGFDLVQAADAGAEDHAAAKRIFLREVEAGVAHGVDAGDHGELREAIEPLGILGRDVVAGRPIVDIAAEVDFELRGVEQPDRMNAAFARENPLPKILDLASSAR